MVPQSNQISSIEFKFNSNILLLFLISCCLVFPAVLQARGFDFKPGKENSVIPFINDSGLVIIPFQLGEEKVNLILDTGIRGIVMFDKKGSFGLKPNADMEISFSGIGNGIQVKGKLISEVVLEANDIEGSGLAVVLLPQNHFAQNLSTEINGLIGYDIFSKFLVSINYKKNHLILTKPENHNPENQYHQMDLILIDTKPYIYSNISSDEIQGKSMALFIDSGAGFDLLLKKDPSQKRNRSKQTILGRGLSGVVKGKQVKVDDFYLGNLFFAHFSIFVPTSGVYLNQDMMADRDGTLGGKFLQRFEEVIFDYVNKKIYFKTNQLMASIES